MKIIQILPTISFGDAVSNDTIALNDAIRKMGYRTSVYAENIDPRLPEGTAKPIEMLPALAEKDILIYHLSTGTELNYTIDRLNGKKLIIYHNVTPPYFLQPYNSSAAQRCAEGLDGAKHLAAAAEYVLADSEFNKEDLLKMGYQCPIDVLPILVAFDDYKKKPSEKLFQKYNDDWVNIIFTGRIAPNKKQEDIISSFYYYKKYINKKSRLFLVGSGSGMENYEARLKRYTRQLELSDVYFTGHVKFDELLAYYQIADVFLCMSEHEGFCVPLVEAMFFDVPIIAYDSSAIGDTLGGSGLLVKEKNFCEIACLLDLLVRNKDLREKVICNQQIRLKSFSHDKIINQFEKYLKGFIEKDER